MEYTEDFIKKIVGVGTLGYSLQKTINVLDIEDKDVEQFTKDFDDEKSKIAKAYQRGIDKADYAVDMKLFELAKNGNLAALKKYEIRKRVRLEDLIKDKEDREKNKINIDN